MKSLKYIWRNVTRNKLRSSLTVFSVGLSLGLLTLMHGYLALQDVWKDEAEKYNRIVVMNTQGFVGDVPIAYVDRVRRVEGVIDAVPYSWFGGNYKDEQMPFAQFGTDPDHVFNVWEEFKINPAELAAWQKNRQGCVVDRRLAAQRGWKIGERIPLEGTFNDIDLDLELCGLFDAPQNTGSLWFHWKYLDEGLVAAGAPNAGNSGTIFAKVESAARIPSVVAEIDEHYASSDNPTRTQTEAAFAQMFTDMLGNVRLYVLSVGVAVVFSLVLVAGTAMAISTRERTTEIAVLKAIGFSRSRVLALVLGEACLIGLLGGLVGVGLGCLLLQAINLGFPQIVPFPVWELAGLWMVWLLLLATGVGLASGLIPAAIASQKSVVQGLRQVN